MSSEVVYSDLPREGEPLDSNGKRRFTKDWLPWREERRNGDKGSGKPTPYRSHRTGAATPTESIIRTYDKKTNCWRQRVARTKVERARANARARTAARAWSQSRLWSLVWSVGSHSELLQSEERILARAADVVV